MVRNKRIIIISAVAGIAVVFLAVRIWQGGVPEREGAARYPWEIEVVVACDTCTAGTQNQSELTPIAEAVIGTLPQGEVELVRLRELNNGFVIRATDRARNQLNDPDFITRIQLPSGTIETIYFRKVGYVVAQRDPIRPSDVFACRSDAECVSVTAEACSCSMGGTATAINGAYEQYWEENLPKDVPCLAVISNHWTCTAAKPECVQSKCTLFPLGSENSSR